MARRLLCRAKGLTKRHRLELQGRLDQKVAEDAEELDGWMQHFDANQNNKLERHELARRRASRITRLLLLDLDPGAPAASEAALDFLLGCHERIISGEVDLASVSRKELRATIEKYRDYVRRSAFLDSVFEKFDENGSGALEAGEVHKFLRALADGSCVCQGDAAIERDQAKLFKLRALAKSLKRGVISQRTFRAKAGRVGFLKATAVPAHQSFEVERGDVDWVLSECSLRKARAVHRDEVFQCIAAWLCLLAETHEADECADGPASDDDHLELVCAASGAKMDALARASPRGGPRIRDSAACALS
ncbi:hypothetical protein M885DRAFT_558355 [Pelagophyceae sp. CCMP2097]|nr:hypothetical protein M885DRAFT_558355 [Pelagophyceae sp. CCMP2097]